MCIHISLSMCMIQIDPITNLKLFFSEGYYFSYRSLGIQTTFSCWIVPCAAMCQDPLRYFQWSGNAARQSDRQTSWQRIKICIFMQFPHSALRFFVFLADSSAVRKVSCLQCFQCCLTLPCPRLSDTICRIQTIPSSDNRQLQLSFGVGAEHQ